VQGVHPLGRVNTDQVAPGVAGAAEERRRAQTRDSAAPRMCHYSRHRAGSLKRTRKTPMTPGEQQRNVLNQKQDLNPTVEAGEDKRMMTVLAFRWDHFMAT